MRLRRRLQPSGSPWSAAIVALLSATACARGWSGQQPAPDAAAEPDAAHVATVDAASTPDAGCAISAGTTPVLGGTNDLGAYPASQQITPGAMLGADGAAIVWDRHDLYITVASSAFAAAYEPLHVYIETTAGELGAPVATQGKEYGGLVPTLPFAPTEVIAVRRVSDSGTGGPYNGVYEPAAGWTTRSLALDALVSADQQVVSIVVPWSALGGCPTAMRIAAHVVHGAAGNEWKDLVPTTHAPWLASGGGFYEADLTAPPAVGGWQLR